jgi:hypothetical protein
MPGNLAKTAAPGKKKVYWLGRAAPSRRAPAGRWLLVRGTSREGIERRANVAQKFPLRKSSRFAMIRAIECTRSLVLRQNE